MQSCNKAYKRKEKNKKKERQKAHVINCSTPIPAEPHTDTHERPGSRAPAATSTCPTRARQRGKDAKSEPATTSATASGGGLFLRKESLKLAVVGGHVGGPSTLTQVEDVADAVKRGVRVERRDANPCLDAVLVLGRY